MNQLDHEEVRDFLGAYALGAVEPDEAAVIRAHLLTCEDCMNQADALAATAATLTAVVEPVEPPAGFAARVVAAAVSERTVPREAPRRRFRWVHVLAYSLLIVAVAVLGAGLAQTRSDLDAYERVVQALLTHADFRLTGAAGIDAGMVGADRGAVFAATGMDEAPSRRTYQLWLMDEGVPVSAGTFDVDDGVAVLSTSHSLRDFDGAAVTIEPEGGSDEPTTAPFMASH
ncbi:MAG: anti-sigma factor domain-containing protein [Actinomycetota bacterium]